MSCALKGLNILARGIALGSHDGQSVSPVWATYHTKGSQLNEK